MTAGPALSHGRACGSFSGVKKPVSHDLARSWDMPVETDRSS